MDLDRKLAILADAAKYDASCASSGTDRRDSVGGAGIGSTEGMGICHSYAPDGRCISLLKILLTNHCQYDCLYCVNRSSSNVARARFSVEEVVRLTLDFYRRNTIEGLFLSSGIIKSPDHTMEQVVRVAQTLREVHDFRGYIHLKTIPDASDELLRRAGRYADRLSINVEMPTEAGLKQLAPEKDTSAIHRSMGRLRLHIDEAREARASADGSTGGSSVGSTGATTGEAPIRVIPGAAPRPARPPRFAPAGQSTQMIVGADDSDDRSILRSSAALYGRFRMRRVYYSAFSPIPDAARALPLKAPPLVREHRLYQADWLMRFYGFDHEEIVDDGTGLLRLDVDPKHAWALAHPERFPVDLNQAPRELLLRVPGLGVGSVDRLIAARRLRRVRAEDLRHMKLPLRRVLPFVIVDGHRPGAAPPAPTRASGAADAGTGTGVVGGVVAGTPTQLGLFG
ncbi:putative DNA modification/repair radical SAM protein [Mitsuaria sp. BK045]|uniref:putative DNA modification/repair radical SAM protein n=1 Tax=unclassified Roseateles TaxID=2626991 RepID=UPI00160C6372|nr:MULTISPECIES: putative DNA modification/repair radical SAM protein [unclassified Roseateles]MBB3293206.1 putative DNA modification/repair radical SAM protein [Mitsuaria sp. BK041]MBB3362423.1 putative DNA modification/repair radical SAM protein [Mitsuaria sp. BK045]